MADTYTFTRLQALQLMKEAALIGADAVSSPDPQAAAVRLLSQLPGLLDRYSEGANVSRVSATALRDALGMAQAGSDLPDPQKLTAAHAAAEISTPVATVRRIRETRADAAQTMRTIA